MRFRRLELVDFGHFERLELELRPGLNVLQGPNEAGKSTLLEALELALYGDATSGAQALRELRRWGAETGPLIRAEMENGAGTYRLTRNFEAGENLLELPDGEVLQDKEAIQREIARLTGLPTGSRIIDGRHLTEAFRSIVCVFQDELARVSEGRASIRQLIEARLSGGGVDLEAVLRDLGRQVQGLTRGGVKNPGQIVRLERELAQLEEPIGQLESQVRRTEESRKALGRVSRELVEARQSLQVKQATLENMSRHVQARERAAEAERRWEQVRQRRGGRADLKTRLAEAQRRVERTSAARRRAELERALERRRLLQERIEGLQKRLSDLPLLGPDEVEALLTLPGQIQALEESLQSHGLHLRLEPERPVEVELGLDEEARPVELEEPLEGEARREIRLHLPGQLTVRVWGLGSGEGSLPRRIEALKAELRAILERHAAEMPLALLEDQEERRRLGRQVEELQAELERLAAEASLEEISKRLEALEGDDEGRPLEELEALERELRAQVAGLQQALEASDPETLGSEEREALKALAVAEERLRELAVYGANPEEHQRLQQEVAKLSERVRRLELEEYHLHNLLAADAPGEDDLAPLYERVALIERQLERYRRRREVLGRVSEFIGAARQMTADRVREELGRRTGQVLHRLTEGRYERVELDPELSLRLYSPAYGDWLEEPELGRALSTATLDQLYLALRLALLELLTGQARPPLLLDDPFNHFDEERLAAAYRILEEISADHQVLALVSRTPPEGFPIAVVHLAGPVVRVG